VARWAAESTWASSRAALPSTPSRRSTRVQDRQPQPHPHSAPQLFLCHPTPSDPARLHPLPDHQLLPAGAPRSWMAVAPAAALVVEFLQEVVAEAALPAPSTAPLAASPVEPRRAAAAMAASAFPEAGTSVAAGTADSHRPRNPPCLAPQEACTAQACMVACRSASSRMARAGRLRPAPRSPHPHLLGCQPCQLR
jgi:hypothetical protein